MLAQTKINPDHYPDYQELVNTLFALNTIAAPKYYTVEVYGLGLVHLNLDDSPFTRGTLSQILNHTKTLFKDAKYDLSFVEH